MGNGILPGASSATSLFFWQNPRTKICVLSGKEPDPFHVRPGGIRVLPT